MHPLSRGPISPKIGMWGGGGWGGVYARGGNLSKEDKDGGTWNRGPSRREHEGKGIPRVILERIVRHSYAVVQAQRAASSDHSRTTRATGREKTKDTRGIPGVLKCIKKRFSSGTSLVVQWLRLRASTA